jgi:hypothetical protein
MDFEPPLETNQASLSVAPDVDIRARALFDIPPVPNEVFMAAVKAGKFTDDFVAEQNTWSPPEGLQVPYGYRCDGTGVWQVPDDEKKGLIQIAKNPCWVVARNREGDSRNWGTTIAWLDSDHVEHKKAFSDERYGEPGNPIVRDLRREGLQVVPSQTGKFVDYLFAFETQKRYTVVPNIGWTNTAELVFVTPHAVIRKTIEETNND